MGPLLQLLWDYSIVFHCKDQQVRDTAYFWSQPVLFIVERYSAGEEIYYDAEETLSDFGEYQRCVWKAFVALWYAVEFNMLTGSLLQVQETQRTTTPCSQFPICW